MQVNPGSPEKDRDYKDACAACPDFIFMKSGKRVFIQTNSKNQSKEFVWIIPFLIKRDMNRPG
jgi:hypothetical protein